MAAAVPGKGEKLYVNELDSADPAGVENIGSILMTAEANTCVFGVPPHARRSLPGGRIEISRAEISKLK